MQILFLAAKENKTKVCLETSDKKNKAKEKLDFAYTIEALH